MVRVSTGVEFKNAVTRWGARAMDPKKIKKKAMQDIAIRLGTYIIRGTPVRTGLARGNWRLSFMGRIGTMVQRTLDKTGQTTIERLKVSARQLGLHSRFKIHNPVPYIGRLESGYSKQAPQGMIRLARTRLMAELGQVKRKLIKEIQQEVKLVS